MELFRLASFLFFSFCRAPLSGNSETPASLYTHSQEVVVKENKVSGAWVRIPFSECVFSIITADYPLSS
jgi:hypothetical protein